MKTLAGLIRATAALLLVFASLATARADPEPNPIHPHVMASLVGK